MTGLNNRRRDDRRRWQEERWQEDGLRRYDRRR